MGIYRSTQIIFANLIQGLRLLNCNAFSDCSIIIIIIIIIAQIIGLCYIFTYQVLKQTMHYNCICILILGCICELLIIPKKQVYPSCLNKIQRALRICFSITHNHYLILLAFDIRILFFFYTGILLPFNIEFLFPFSIIFLFPFSIIFLFNLREAFTFLISS